MSRIHLTALAATLHLAAACTQRPPFVVLSIEDPTSAATNFSILEVGLSRDSLEAVKVSTHNFPLAVTVTAKTTGEKTLWVEVRAADGTPLARGTTQARFARTGTTTATVQLAKACDDSTQCDDGIYCNGVETCADGMCVASANPCAANVDCVTSTCVELGNGQGACNTVVHHDQCPTGSYCNPIRGCVQGQGCLRDVDCDDALVCNGVERCINLVCAPGVPPTLDDGDACTLDGCDDSRTALGENPIFHVALPSFDGRDCTIPSGGGDGVCVSAKGGCSVSVCGDGVLAANEECEDGNVNPNDGCDNCKYTQWASQVLVGKGEGQGLATGVALNSPSGVAVDRNGNIFIADTNNNRIRRVDGATGVITTIAGTGAQGFSGDNGPATSATLNSPYAVSVDGSGSVFIADSWNHRIRRVDGANGLITTIAGTGTQGFSGDNGPATSANLAFPFGVSVDGSGSVFIADRSNNRIRRVDGASGLITTIAGTGTQGFSGDNGPATSATLHWPSAVSVDGSGSIFIADTFNHRIRRVDGASGVITTIAGTGIQGFSGDNGPATSANLNYPQSVSVDGSGSVFTADWSNHRIRRVDGSSGVITTIAGTGTQGFSGDNGPATSATLNGPFGVSVGGAGRVFIADTNNNRVRWVDGASGVITTIAGTGTAGFSGDDGPATSANLDLPVGLCVDGSGNVFIADTENNRIRRVDGASGLITTIAGTGTQGFSGDNGPATSATLHWPSAVSVDGSGNVFVVDTYNSRIRRVDGVSGVITTIAGTGMGGFSGDNGPATSAKLNWPGGVSVDGWGGVFIADGGNNRIRRVDGASGVITTIAGTGASDFSGDNGPATSANLNYPCGISLDGSGNVFIADRNNNRIRRVDGASGIITTIAGTGTPAFSGDNGPATGASLASPSGVSVDGSGGVLIADSNNHRIRRVDGASGVITTVAGTGTLGFSGDTGPATSANLYGPSGVSVGGSGSVFIADTSNSRIRRVDGVSGGITTIAGSVDPVGDGPLLQSALGNPRALLALDSGAEWLVADGVTGQLRDLNTASGWLASRVGYPNGFTGDGVNARGSRFLVDARGIAVDSSGATVFISEYGGSTIRAIDTAATPWTISTFAGTLPRSVCCLEDGDPTCTPAENAETRCANDSPGYLNASGTAARFSNPSGLLFNASTRELLVADAGNHIIRSIHVDSGATTTIAGTPRFRGFFGEGVDALQALFNSPQAMAFGNDGSLYVADTGNNRVRRIDQGGLIDTVLGDGTEASSGEGGPARYFPVDQPTGLAVDSFGNLFVSSSTALRIVTAGADNLATGDDNVMTLYGRPPRESFPEPVTFCLAGIAVLDGDGGAKDGRLYVLDACAGFMLQLDRQAL